MIIIFLSLIYSAFACECYYVPLKTLKENPQNANTAFVGSYEKGKSLLRIQFSWSKYRPALTIPNENKCSLHLEDGGKYLFLSLNEGSPNICNSIAIKMSEAKKFMTKLEMRKNENYGSLNPSWVFCEKNDDCMADKSICGENAAINKRFSEPFKSWVKKVAPTMNCISVVAGSSKAICQSNLCIIH